MIADWVISIHAPPRGATARQRRTWCRAIYFNSRPSARGDVHGQKGRTRRAISIHAPPRGATHAATGNAAAVRISIHAPPRGATAHSAAVRCFSAAFQFTPLREGRLRGVRESGRRENFNSRPSARGDPLGGLHSTGGAISIHAPPRGATGRVVFLSFVAFHFNSRPSARGDMVYLHRSSIYGISIHAPPRGATGLHFLCVGYSVFQFTPLREGRQNSRGNLRRYYKRFQFTPLREGRRRTPTTKTTERLFQFTPLREGRLADVRESWAREKISIHAPPRGATIHG